MTMDKNVDAFAARIRNDAQLAGGFNCVGFSRATLSAVATSRSTTIRR